MFGDLPDPGSPGFRVRQPEDTPGFRVSDTGIQSADEGTSNFLSDARPCLADLQDAAEKVGRRANAVINGAYSVFPGAYNAVRARLAMRCPSWPTIRSFRTIWPVEGSWDIFPVLAWARWQAMRCGPSKTATI